MKSTSVFLDITKVADFLWKNADVTRIQGMSHVICMILDHKSAKFRHCSICMTDFKEGDLLATPICEHPRKGPSWTGLNKMLWDQYRELYGKK